MLPETLSLSSLKRPMMKKISFSFKHKTGFLCIKTHGLSEKRYLQRYLRTCVLGNKHHAGAWGCCGQVNSGILATLQKRVGRIVIKTSSSDTAMKALKWPSLRSRLDEHILKLVRKCIHDRCPQYFKNYFVFNKDIWARSTRQSNLLHLPAIRKEVAKRSFHYHGSILF